MKKVALSFLFAWLLPNTIQAQTVYFPSFGITVAGSPGGISGNTPDLLNDPAAIYVDDTGNIYVVDLANERIQKWAPGASSGITIAGGNGGGASSKQLSAPRGIFVDDSGYVYIADRYNKRVQKWREGIDSGITVAGGNGSGNAANQVSPEDVWVDKAGAIYILDDDYRVQKWVSGADSGITVAGGHGNGSANNQFYAAEMFLDSMRNMYICDIDNYRILKWHEGDTTGIVVAGGNGGGTANNQFDFPSGIALDKNNNMYIVDGSHNARIFKWAMGVDSGIVIEGNTNANLAQFHEPYCVRLVHDTLLYLVDAGHNRVLEFIGHYAPISVPQIPVLVKELNVYPNPSVGNITISGELDMEDKRIPIAVINTLGQQVYDTWLDIRNRKINKTLQIQFLSTGTYYLYINGNQYLSSFVMSKY